MLVIRLSYYYTKLQLNICDIINRLHIFMLSRLWRPSWIESQPEAVAPHVYSDFYHSSNDPSGRPDQLLRFLFTKASRVWKKMALDHNLRRIWWFCDGAAVEAAMNKYSLCLRSCRSSLAPKHRWETESGAARNESRTHSAPGLLGQMFGPAGPDV